ncbi:MAG: hypothetical protein JJT94_01200 [Bernardetiaceae bacterium]|nr:hypothetical protein [Bernardetiaceae bacterium]
MTNTLKLDKSIYRISTATIEFDNYSNTWRIIIESTDVYFDLYPLTFNHTRTPQGLANQSFPNEMKKFGGDICIEEEDFLVKNILFKTSDWHENSSSLDIFCIGKIVDFHSFAMKLSKKEEIDFSFSATLIFKKM